MVYYAKSRTSLLFGNTKIYLGDFGKICGKNLPNLFIAVDHYKSTE